MHFEGSSNEEYRGCLVLKDWKEFAYLLVWMCTDASDEVGERLGEE